MITEDYVSFETFKLLKEKGFDDSCCRFVIESDETYYRGAPTLQMAMKWLREVHNIVLNIYANDHDNIIKWRIEAYKVYLENDCLLHNGIMIWDAFIPSYEEAVEVAIKYCLKNLI